MDAVGSHRTSTDGAHFEHTQTKRCDNAALKERSWIAKPQYGLQRSKTSAGAHQRALCKRRGHPWHLHGDVTEGFSFANFGPNIGPFPIEY